MKYVILITGASSGFGALTARYLAEAGYTVYASMRDTSGRNVKQVEAARKFANEKSVDLRTVELDVSSQESADQAVRQILSELNSWLPTEFATISTSAERLPEALVAH